jgi:cytochrome c-type biogenesis protein CcmH/NrfG
MKLPVLMVLLFLSTAAWARETTAPSVPGKVPAAALKRDTALCHAHADLDACYDAIRWNPGDPALLVALGNALLVAQRPADALRNYQRAAALAPNTPGIAAKIKLAQVRMTSRRPAPPPPKRYSNAAPEAQSH